MTSVCIFCCTRLKVSDKNYEEETTSSSEEILKTFLKVTQSQFGINVTNYLDEGRENVELLEKVCLKCEHSLKSICQLSKELECIRLKLEWEFGALISKMEVVGRTPSKIKWLRRNQQAKDFQNMTDFRNNFISKCNQSLSKSIPRVIIQPSVISEESPFSPINDEKTNLKFSDDVDMDSDDLNVKCSPAKDELPMIPSPSLPPSPFTDFSDSDSDSDTSEDKLPPRPRRLKQKPLQCPQCPVRFSNQNSLRRHLRKLHQIYQTNRKIPVKKSIKPRDLPEKAPKFVKCSICRVPLRNLKLLLRSHFDVNHSRKGIDPKSLHRCDYANCSAYFRTLFQVTRHKIDAHGEDHYIPKTTCPICSKNCSELNTLKVHMKKQHNDESPDLPLACEVPKCTKRFPNEAILKWHRMYYNHHNRKQSFEVVNCPECHQEFRGMGALKKHQKIHQRPEAHYVCELCGAAFKRKSTLTTHSLFHEDPDNWAFQCEECGKKCATKQRLQDHMAVHSDVRSFSCEACGKGFKFRQKLREHVNKFHAEEGFQDIPRKKAKVNLNSRRLIAT